jgi:hypothetical protein
VLQIHGSVQLLSASGPPSLIDLGSDPARPEVPSCGSVFLSFSSETLSDIRFEDKNIWKRNLCPKARISWLLARTHFRTCLRSWRTCYKAIFAQTSKSTVRLGTERKKSAMRSCRTLFFCTTVHFSSMGCKRQPSEVDFSTQR